jgi:hypothetical protein
MNQLILLLIIETFTVMLLFEFITSRMKQGEPVTKEIYKSLFIGVLIAIILYTYIKFY